MSFLCTLRVYFFKIMNKTRRQDTFYIFIKPLIGLVAIKVLIPQGPLEVNYSKDVFNPTTLRKAA